VAGKIADRLLAFRESCRFCEFCLDLELGNDQLCFVQSGRYWELIGLLCLLHCTEDRQVSLAHWWFETRFTGTAL